MCYFVVVATPLTLSEVRSMLPAGISAQPVDAATATAYRRVHPPAHTVATLLAGRCSCDLVRARDPDPREDERHLRQRYAGLGFSRTRIIAELERHRGVGARRLATPRDLVDFVAEHARNAGPTLYALGFGSPEAEKQPGPAAVETRTLGQLRASPATWLDEAHATLVRR